MESLYNLQSNKRKSTSTSGPAEKPIHHLQKHRDTVKTESAGKMPLANLSRVKGQLDLE